MADTEEGRSGRPSASTACDAHAGPIISGSAMGTAVTRLPNTNAGAATFAGRGLVGGTGVIRPSSRHSILKAACEIGVGFRPWPSEPPWCATAIASPGIAHFDAIATHTRQGSLLLDLVDLLYTFPLQMSGAVMGVIGPGGGAAHRTGGPRLNQANEDDREHWQNVDEPIIGVAGSSAALGLNRPPHPRHKVQARRRIAQHLFIMPVERIPQMTVRRHTPRHRQIYVHSEHRIPRVPE